MELANKPNTLQLFLKTKPEVLLHIHSSLRAYIFSQHLILFRTNLLLSMGMASAICQHHLLPIKIKTRNAYQSQ
jgi:hypothetical protein